jgi:hypothetical protein
VNARSAARPKPLAGDVVPGALAAQPGEVLLDPAVEVACGLGQFRQVATGRRVPDGPRVHFVPCPVHYRHLPGRIGPDLVKALLPQPALAKTVPLENDGSEPGHAGAAVRLTRPEIPGANFDQVVEIQRTP